MQWVIGHWGVEMYNNNNLLYAFREALKKLVKKNNSIKKWSDISPPFILNDNIIYVSEMVIMVKVLYMVIMVEMLIRSRC